MKSPVSWADEHAGLPQTVDGGRKNRVSVQEPGVDRSGASAKQMAKKSVLRAALAARIMASCRGVNSGKSLTNCRMRQIVAPIQVVIGRQEPPQNPPPNPLGQAAPGLDQRVRHFLAGDTMAALVLGVEPVNLREQGVDLSFCLTVVPGQKQRVFLKGRRHQRPYRALCQHPAKKFYRDGGQEEPDPRPGIQVGPGRSAAAWSRPRCGGARR